MEDQLFVAQQTLDKQTSVSTAKFEALSHAFESKTSEVIVAQQKISEYEARTEQLSDQLNSIRTSKRELEHQLEGLLAQNSAKIADLTATAARFSQG